MSPKYRVGSLARSGIRSRRTARRMNGGLSGFAGSPCSSARSTRPRRVRAGTTSGTRASRYWTSRNSTSRRGRAWANAAMSARSWGDRPPNPAPTASMLEATWSIARITSPILATRSTPLATIWTVSSLSMAVVSCAIRGPSAAALVAPDEMALASGASADSPPGRRRPSWAKSWSVLPPASWRSSGFRTSANSRARSSRVPAEEAIGQAAGSRAAGSQAAGSQAAAAPAVGSRAAGSRAPRR
jgi:hypothetical protein